MNPTEDLARRRRAVRRTVGLIFGGALVFLLVTVFFAVARMPHMLGTAMIEARAVRVEKGGVSVASVTDRAARERLAAAVQGAGYHFAVWESLRRRFSGIEPGGATRTVTVETTNYQSSVVFSADGRELAARWFVFETDAPHAAAWLRALDEATAPPANAP